MSAIEIDNVLHAQCLITLPPNTQGIAQGANWGFTGQLAQTVPGRVTLRLSEPVDPDECIVILDWGTSATYAANPVQRAAFINPVDHAELVIEQADPSNALLGLQATTLVTVLRFPS